MGKMIKSRAKAAPVAIHLQPLAPVADAPAVVIELVAPRFKVYKLSQIKTTVPKGDRGLIAREFANFVTRELEFADTYAKVWSPCSSLWRKFYGHSWYDSLGLVRIERGCGHDLGIDRNNRVHVEFVCEPLTNDPEYKLKGRFAFTAMGCFGMDLNQPDE